MTIKFENTNERYGDSGPFEVDSKEALADDVSDMITDCALAEIDPNDSGIYSDDDLADSIKEVRAEFIKGLVAQYHGESRIIFDNAGSITLQLPGFAHTYNDAEQCATDLMQWIEDEDTSDWEGNDEDAVFEPTIDQQANGGYDVRYLDAFLMLGLSEIVEESGNNIRNLYAALAQKMLCT